MRMKAIALAVLLAASTAFAEDIEAIDVNALNVYGLDEAELAHYNRLEREIGCAFEGAADPVDVARSLSRDVSANVTTWNARSSLVRSLGQAVFAAAPDPLELASSLLAAREEELRDLAYGELLNGDAWTTSETIRQQLIRLLDDPAIGEERATIVQLFVAHRLLDVIGERAVALAADHSDPDLAHQVAQAIVLSHSYVENGNAAIAAYAASDARALREEAARGLPCSETSGEALLLLLSVAKDDSEPAWVRGNAVHAIAGVCTKDDPRRVAAVLELSERRNWFFGAPGNHFPVHSLALLIPELARVDTAVTRARLDALPTEIRTLPDDQRGYVEWILGHATEARVASPSP